MSDDKKLLASDTMVSRVSKILNQAERAEEGSPEREAFMEKALQLSQAYSIDLAVARAAQAKKERVEEPERRSFRVAQEGLSAAKNAHFAELMIAICDANDIRVTISFKNTYVHGTGMPSDLDMAERIFAILAIQMMQEADAGLKRGDNTELKMAPKTIRTLIPEDERAWGQHDGSDSYGDSCYYDEKDDQIEEGLRYRWGSGWSKSYPPPRFQNLPIRDDSGAIIMEKKRVSVSDARVWRVNFYAAFVNRTRYRLREIKQQAMKDAGIDVQDTSDSRAVALRDKAKEVRDAFEENEKHVLATGRSWAGASVTSHSASGQLAGDEAGKRARLGNEKDLD